MIAVDTNVILRALLEDDERQSADAARLLRSRCFVPITVVLELVWVLENVLKLSHALIIEFLADLAAIDHVEVEHAGAVTAALEWFLRGMDFPDALHVATAAHCDRFATFDKAMIRSAHRIGLPLQVAAP